MITRLSDLFPLLLVSGVAAVFIGPALIRASARLGLLDVPGSQPHKQHGSPTPLVGGLTLGGAMAVAYVTLRPEVTPQVGGIVAAAGVMLFGGLVDDRVALRPLTKLLAQALSCAVLIALGVQVHVTRAPLLDMALTFLWVIGMANAFNFVDSMDGLAIGLAGIGSAFFMLVTIDSHQPDLAALSAILLGACAGTFFHNANPARMFLGDAGAELLGLVLAGIGIAYTPGQAGLPQALTWFIPILVLGVPIFDTALVVASRIRGRRPVYRGGRDHTFHRLVAIGLDPNRSVLAMQLAAATLGLIAFIVLDTSVLIANLVFGLLVLGGILALIVLERLRVRA